MYEETDSGVPPVSTPSARPPAQSQPPPPVEEDLPKIRNIYDELKPQSLGEPPPKPPRQGQGSPPQTKRKQPTTNGVAPSSREGRAPPPAANVSELDALLETLGSNVQQNADITSGMHGCRRHAWGGRGCPSYRGRCVEQLLCAEG